MNIVDNPAREEWERLMQRPTIDCTELQSAVRTIMNDVKERGDDALREYTITFDRLELEDAQFSLRVAEEDILSAGEKISAELRNAIEIAAENITTFHKAQTEESVKVETSEGVQCWRKSLPIQSVGLYIPGGTAPLFSTVLMLGIPAVLAGCKNIALCTPPDRSGSVAPAILYAARLVGIKDIYRIGGAQAIAALAYGTESIPKVSKIFGPGNQYVTAAKQIVASEEIRVGIDMPAGPTELLILADDKAHPEFVAADILSQAEHGIDSQVVVCCTDRAVLEAAQKAVAIQLEKLPRRDIAVQALKNSRLILFEDIDQAVAFSNSYAPEHLILAVAHLDRVAEDITAAGSVFLGNYTPESAGDYASGTNHTLPTGGAALYTAGVSLDSFLNKVTFQKISERGLVDLGPAIEEMAEAEGLSGHARAVSVRTNALKKEGGEDVSN